MTRVPQYKYGEARSLKEVEAYVNSTYKEHYATSSIQTGEFLIALGHGATYFLCNVIKYASRYGKKDGHNRRDILKIIHYGLMLLHVHDQEHKESV
jgi:hypothetical protein